MGERGVWNKARSQGSGVCVRNHTTGLQAIPALEVLYSWGKHSDLEDEINLLEEGSFMKYSLCVPVSLGQLGKHEVSFTIYFLLHSQPCSLFQK